MNLTTCRFLLRDLNPQDISICHRKVPHWRQYQKHQDAKEKNKTVIYFYHAVRMTAPPSNTQSFGFRGENTLGKSLGIKKTIFKKQTKIPANLQHTSPQHGTILALTSQLK